MNQVGGSRIAAEEEELVESETESCRHLPERPVRDGQGFGAPDETLAESGLHEKGR